MADWFDQWAARHGTTFGISSDADAATMRTWKRVFEASDYTVAELNAATDTIAVQSQRIAGASARFLGKMMAHLEAIRSCIAEARTIDYRRDVDHQREDRGTCNLCGGTGRVVVPHLDCIANGQWVPVRVTRRPVGSLYTCAVLCSCDLGHWFGDRSEVQRGTLKGSRMLSIYDYAKRNPMWRNQLQQRQMEQAAVIDHADGSRCGELSPQIERLLAAFGKEAKK